MIPRSYIARWKDQAPWTTNEQVEQDLIISRALVALFSDEYLSENLAFRGGTALHKLYLSPAPRYSEDIDLVQIKEGQIKPILKRIGEVITFFEEDRVVKPKANNNTLLYRFNSEYSPDIRLKLKIEINCREHFNILGWNSFPFSVDSERESFARGNLKEAGGKIPIRGTRTSSGIPDGDEFAKQNEVLKLHGRWDVNDAGTWNEGYLSYHGRSHGRTETEYEAGSKQGLS